MPKLSKYFNSIEELEAYFPNGVSSQFLAYVKDADGEFVLFTSTNNFDKTDVNVGGYIDSPEEKQEKEEIEDYALLILNGNSEENTEE